MKAMVDSEGITVVEAQDSDIESLTTIVPRAFHLENRYINHTLPDTQAVREWWSLTFQDSVQDPDCHVLIVREPDTSSTAGLLMLRSVGPEMGSTDVWNLRPCPEDIDQNSLLAMVDAGREWHGKLIRGWSHFIVELFGVDHEWKGKGVGMKLLRRACEIADGKGFEIFVEANGFAKGYYEKVGFRSEKELVLAGEGNGEYVECMMVRSFRADAKDRQDRSAY